MKKYSHVHRKQLFHWIGHHIDHPTPGASQIKLDDTARQKYMAALKAAIQRGLWVKTPRDPDRLGNVPAGTHFEVCRPISCFTEWLVGESLPHTTRYGRLGLGFPRDFVLKRGGHPVIYVKGINAGDQYTKNLLTIRDFLNDPRLIKEFSANEIGDHRKRLEYITHFAKWTRKPPAIRIVRSKGGKKSRIVRQAPTTTEINFNRNFGPLQEFLEEREWRIVYHNTFRRYFDEPNGETPAPDYYMPFQTGKDLFTVVLPDNRTVNMVMNNKFFVRKFFPADAPHVTVLSLDDVNTF